MPRLEAAADVRCLDGVHVLLDELWAGAPDVPDDERHRFATAVAEVVANVVEHGAHPDGRPVTLSVDLEADAAAITARVEDDGPDPGELPAVAEVDLLAESGRGLLIARAAVDEVWHGHRDGHNHWQLVLHRTRGSR